MAMIDMQHSKKRKYETSQVSDEVNIHHDGNIVDNNDEMIDDDMESVLFNEMSLINGQLISLANKVKLVNHRYFMHNSAMVDEFIGNIHEFLKQVDIHRKRVSIQHLNSDTLFNIYQYLETPMLVGSCQLVSKMWKETLGRLDITVNFSSSSKNSNKNLYYNVSSFLKSSIVRQTTQMTLSGATADIFQMISKSTKFEKLKSLDLTGNNLGITSTRHLKKFTMPSLTELNLENVNKFKEKEAKELFSSNLMSNIKNLNLSNFNITSIYETLADCEHLKQLTHLNLYQGADYIDKSQEITSFLEENVNLEHLVINITAYRVYKTLRSGIFSNMSLLDISNSKMLPQHFVDLVVSTELPKLTTLIAQTMQFTEATTKVHIPESQSSITELDLSYSNTTELSTLMNCCSKLKRLTFTYNDTSFIDTPALSKLEYLSIAHLSTLIQFTFESPIFSNLKVLDIKSDYTSFRSRNIETKWILDSTNLVNLSVLHAQHLSEEVLEALKTNPTFSNLRQITYS